MSTPIQSASEPSLCTGGPQAPPDRDHLQRRISELGEWFHNLDLFGVRTAPDHFLGDYPNVKWRQIAQVFPDDLHGATVLDIGCNGGFYALEMKRRGADRVLGIDVDDRYLNQARFAASTLGLQIELEKCSVYDVDAIAGKFDIVLFLGVFYHLRYPLLALDKAVKKVAGKMVFQTMLRGSENARDWQSDYHFWNKDIFEDPDFPAAYFIEHRYANDPTNWFIPNRGAAEGMLRTAGLEIVDHPESETWVCVPDERTRGGEYVLDLELAGRL